MIEKIGLGAGGAETEGNNSSLIRPLSTKLPPSVQTHRGHRRGSRAVLVKFNDDRMADLHLSRAEDIPTAMDFVRILVMHGVTAAKIKIITTTTTTTTTRKE